MYDINIMCNGIGSLKAHDVKSCNGNTSLDWSKSLTSNTYTYTANSRHMSAQKWSIEINEVIAVNDSFLLIDVNLMLEPLEPPLLKRTYLGVY